MRIWAQVFMVVMPVERVVTRTVRVSLGRLMEWMLVVGVGVVVVFAPGEGMLLIGGVLGGEWEKGMDEAALLFVDGKGGSTGVAVGRVDGGVIGLLMCSKFRGNSVVAQEYMSIGRL